MACLDTREKGHQEQQGWRRSISSFVTRTFEAGSRYRGRSLLHTMVPASILSLLQPQLHSGA